jgi:hypothetical protein
MNNCGEGGIHIATELVQGTQANTVPQRIGCIRRIPLGRQGSFGERRHAQQQFVGDDAETVHV